MRKTVIYLQLDVGKIALRSAQQYLESLRDGREVWLNGESIDDVTRHPSLKRCAYSFSQTYDIQKLPQNIDNFTYETSDGDRRNICYKLPRTVDDLERMAKLCEELQLMSGGVLFRTPHSNFYSLFPQHYNLRPLFAKYNARYAENIENYYEFFAKNDLMVAGGFTSPKGNREKPPHLQDDPDINLRILEKNKDGIIVKGAKLLSTAAPFANEIYVTTPDFLGEKDKDYALCFTLPANAKGVKLLCRQPLWMSDNEFDYPLSSRFDEMDATIILDHVFVPWDRVFYAGEHELSNVFLSTFNPWGALVYLTWCAVRAELLVGSGRMATDSSGTTSFPQVKEKLADVAIYASALRAFVTAGMKTPITTDSGLVAPNPEFVAMGKAFVRNNYHAVVDQLYEIVAGFTIVAPTYNELQSEETGEYYKKYFRAKNDAVSRTSTYRLIKELIGSTYGDRLELFQMFSEGSPASVKAAGYSCFDFEKCVDLAKRLSGTLGTSRTNKDDDKNNQNTTASSN
jgi:aromatic ring hydroxylase